MIVDCISDLHGFYPELESGDLLIVAGDLTSLDQPFQYESFFEWLRNQDYKKKVFIAGNHDNHLEEMIHKQVFDDQVTYLCDSVTEFQGLKIWGSPWSTTFAGMNPRCCAFTVNSDEQLAKKWELIPHDTDILITHSPSFGNFDITTRGASVGSTSLWMKILTVKPRLHVFGHIHESYGRDTHQNGTTLVNASYVNEKYQPVNKPIRLVI